MSRVAPNPRPAAAATADGLTLRGGIVDLVNTLIKLENNVTDLAQLRQIQRLLRVFDPLLKEVLYQRINNATADFKAAANGLVKAETDAQAALTDIKQVAAAIQTATAAAKMVDKVVGLIGDLL